jgi:hypothetical protein
MVPHWYDSFIKTDLEKWGRGGDGRGGKYTVKRVDEVVPHRHLVTQDQTTQVSNKFLDDNRQTYCLQMSN